MLVDVSTGLGINKLCRVGMGDLHVSNSWQCSKDLEKTLVQGFVCQMEFSTE